MSKSAFYLALVGTVVGIGIAGDRTEPSAEPKVVTRADGTRELRIPRSRDGHFYTHAMVNGQLVRFLIDTGATSIALTIEDAERVGEKFSRADFEVVGSGASGPVRGQSIRIDSIELGGREVTNLRGAVLDGLDISLLGQSFLSRTRSVHMTGEEMIIR